MARIDDNGSSTVRKAGGVHVANLNVAAEVTMGSLSTEELLSSKQIRAWDGG
jgi:hypothetical protein